MSNQPFLSVVIPSYNESQNIERGALDSVFEYLSKQKYAWELIFTDDGSTDGTPEKLEALAKKHAHVVVLRNVHRGKGPTVLAGMEAAQGKYRLFTDFDQATPLAEVENLLPFFDRGYDVAIGSREGKGASREHEPFHRHFIGRAFNIIVNMIAIQGFQDTQCGFKMFTAEAVERLFPMLSVYKPGAARLDSYTGAFDVELLYIAKKLRMKIAEVPVQWRYVQTVRVDPIKDSSRMFIDLVRIRLADLRGAYKRS
jgi:glycosyltransferase involved in cell wall biosynthesis